MTVVYYGNAFYTCVSGDTKPTTNVATNSRLYETDTRRNYNYNGTSWDLFNGISRTHFWMGAERASASTASLRYGSAFGGVIQAGTESTMTSVYPYAFTVRHLAARLQGNSTAGPVVVSFRDDGADVTGATVTITAASTAEFTASGLNVAVAAGSAICFKFDTSAIVSGNWIIGHVYVVADVLM